MINEEKSYCFRARCSKCQVNFFSELTSIKNHSKSIGHENAVKSTPKGQSFLTTSTSNTISSINQQVQKAEIKLSGFLAEHNIFFLSIDHFEPLLKDIFPDSKICQNIKLKRTKATNIIKNVFAPIAKDILIKKLNNTKFSVIIDESTEIDCTSTMCIVIRVFGTDTSIGKISTQFWDLLPVYNCEDPDQVNAGATAENIFSNVIN